MSEQDICVIVPTIREYECMREYVANAREYGFDTDRLFVVLVTEDFCDTDEMAAMLDDLGVDGAVFDGTAREAWFAEQGVDDYSHLIPEASHAQTSFGLLYMWANERFEYGVFIDDDTLPHDEDFFGTHMENLAYEGEIEARASDESWVNVLDDADADLYPRGYPYAAMDEDLEREPTRVDDVVASQGLWTNVPDLDAVRILMDGDLQGQAQSRTARADFGEDFVAAEGQYLTVCSMNLAFRREVIPAFYQLPMDDNRWDVGRFDDIWSGLFLKRACDVLGKQVYNGGPLCEHNKAPRSTFDDLQNEVAGLELNEHVWEVIDDAAAGASSYREAFASMADALAAGDFEAWNNGEFLNYCGEYMNDWLDCLDALETPAADRVEVPADD
ncbi:MULTISPECIES: alpha-1 4-glucan-protein synthase [Halolamina]|uniref:Reversibly glycosylated polypeptide n=1 Tax=Halolamina pelagica TaxID=699431 RepID=A0A1I5MQC7_9EURY|nr:MULTISPECIES: alpha-1 4-glucan-protein synthase [Halolamina]NHX36097.1 alpha-1 4-glucan-protein synthase [Halolamina sp. R1-12]SFP11111.1 Reversibly glycosylated polypeptide [Halolamina pelagica]